MPLKTRPRADYLHTGLQIVHHITPAVPFSLQLAQPSGVDPEILLS